MTHPQALGDFGDAAAIFRLAEAVDDGAFKIAYFNGLLLRHPVFHTAEIVLRLDVDKAELRAVDNPASQPLRTGREDGQLGLRHHPVYLHGRCMRDEARRAPGQPFCREKRIACVLGGAAQLRWNDDEHAGFQARDKAAAHGLVQKAARQVRTEAGNLLGIRKRECRLRPVVETSQEAGRLAPDSLALDIRLRAHINACEATCSAYNITFIMVCVKKSALQATIST